MKITVLAALLFAFLALGTASAADPINLQLSSVEEQPGRISATVSVVNAEGRPITGLGTPNFKASLGDAPLNVSDLLGSSAARQPASIVLLVDISGSMGGDPITQAKIAMQDFVRTLDPVDRVAIVTFGTKVTPWLDFTADRAAIIQSISRITAVGETALYDGVLDGLAKISEAPPGRRMVVLLSDGAGSIALEKRDATIEAAKATGVSVTALGFGSQIDSTYLNELAGASGGRVLLTSTAAGLRQTYADVANSIRSQYTVVVSVPKTVDRSTPAKLTLQVTLRADSAIAEKDLGPLQGAVAPGFDLTVSGLKSGQRLSKPGLLPLNSKPAAGVNLTKVDYFVDGQLVHSSTAAPFSFDFDSTPLKPGSHLLSTKAVESGGRTGEAQISFTVLAPAKASPINGQMIMIALLGALVCLVAYFVIRKQKDKLRGAAGARILPFAKRSNEPMMPVDGWPSAPVSAPTPLPPPVNRALGRIVVMDEAAVRSGNLDAIEEFEIKTQPLTLGTGEQCDIKLVDDQGRIAAEEARLWVQRGRLVYHKLTTLSAMATEGVTSGWEFLESGEEMRLGAYRILFEQYAADRPTEELEPEPPAEPEEPLRPLQEHGMTLSDLWTRVREETQLSQPNE